jgi:hypothetical protein
LEAAAIWQGIVAEAKAALRKSPRLEQEHQMV